MSNPTADHLATIVGPVVTILHPIAADAGLSVALGCCYLLTTFDHPDAFFVIAGRVTDRPTLGRLQRFADRLQLTRSWLAADPTDVELAAFRGRADVLIPWSSGLAAAGPARLARAIAPVIAR
jgi:hypothetical protein